MFALRDLHEIAGLPRPELKDPAHHPIDHPLLQTERSIFHVIRDAGSILLQHPYEAFASSLERFLKEAAEDPKVRAIKMTLYRTASESSILEHLLAAARNGKQVAVVVELKARFDEEANIRLASRMEEAGIHVTYGVVGLKTHAKITLVVRQDYNGLQRYVHVGTGNYHPVTSRLYADLGLLTADETIGTDATELFNYLTTGFTPKRVYRKLLVAPKSLKPALLEKIRREIQAHAKAGGGLIRFKMNALEDADIARALYEASRAGVVVDLIVRDSCRVRPGVPGISETIRVISIVGRFLEHARVYYFRNGGEGEYYIGSADAMKRNLEYRVEVLAPVESPSLRAELKALLDVQWNDRRSAWEMRADGTYVQRQPPGKRRDAEPGSQEALIRLAEKRLKTATRLRKRTSLTPGRAEPPLGARDMPSFLLPAGLGIPDLLERLAPVGTLDAGAGSHEPSHVSGHLRLAPAPGGVVSGARRRRRPRLAALAPARRRPAARPPDGAGDAVRPRIAVRSAARSARAGASPAGAPRDRRRRRDRDPDRRALRARSHDDAARFVSTRVAPPGSQPSLPLRPLLTRPPRPPRGRGGRAVRRLARLRTGAPRSHRRPARTPGSIAARLFGQGQGPARRLVAGARCRPRAAAAPARHAGGEPGRRSRTTSTPSSSTTCASRCGAPARRSGRSRASCRRRPPPASPASSPGCRS